MSANDGHRTLHATIERLLSLPALIIGFILDVIVLYAIFGIRRTGPILSIELDPIMQLTILGCAAILYYGILRRCWEQLQYERGRAAPVRFQQYLEKAGYYSPLAYAFLLMGIYGRILLNAIETTLFFTAVAGVGILIAWAYKRAFIGEEELSDASHIGPRQMENVLRGWREIINQELKKRRYVTDVELSHKCYTPVIYCRRALQLYHQEYGAKKGLALLDDDLRRAEFPEKIWVLVHRSLRGERPWSFSGNYIGIKPMEPWD